MLGMKYVEAPVRSASTFIESEDWVMSQKLDGTRIMAHVTRDDDAPLRIEFLGAGGGPVKFAAARQHFTRLRARLEQMDLPTCVIDGELLLDGSYWAFDLPYMRGVTGPDEPFYRRFQHLLDAGLRTAPTAFETGTKQELWDTILEQNAEGAIVRPAASLYEVGRRSKDVRKLKLVKTADVVVKSFTRGRNDAGREVGSARLAVYDDAGALRTVGACSLIGKPQVAVGDVVEVRFLYATSGLVLYQPRLVRVREDKDPSECTLEGVRQFVTDRSVITL